VSLLGTMRRDATGLALFAALTVGVIAVTQLLTADRIAAAQRKMEARALLEILPQARFDNELLDDRVAVAEPRLGLTTPADAYIARRDGVAVAALVPLRVPDGYSGAIRLVVGIERDGTLTGVRVLEHRETPGLGDKIERRKSDWIDAFRGRSLEDPAPEGWTVKTPTAAFDAFTGATITPRAVVRGVRRSLEWYRDRGRAQLFGADAEPARNESGVGP
jgi:electron transport complex protein RnfG